MYYVLIIQDGRIMPDCFSRGRFSIHDGPLRLFRINLGGTIIEACEGTVSKGKFHEE